MGIDDLRKVLADLPNGTTAEISYGTYEEFFPPGEPDQGARERCFKFARSMSCRVENVLDKNTIRFIKDI